jgi:hypothetical protein
MIDKAVRIVEECIAGEKHRLNLRDCCLNGEDLDALFAPLLNSPAALERISSIILRNTRIEALPDCIGRFAALKSLDAGLTLLTELPKSMSGLSCLESLYIEGTNITRLPGCLLQLPSLTKVVVYENIIFPIREIKEYPRPLIGDTAADLVDLAQDVFARCRPAPSPPWDEERGLPVMAIGNMVVEFESYFHFNVPKDFTYPYNFSIWYNTPNSQ